MPSTPLLFAWLHRMLFRLAVHLDCMVLSPDCFLRRLVADATARRPVGHFIVQFLVPTWRAAASFCAFCVR